MMSMEAKMDRIKKKETNKYKIFLSLRLKLAETEEMTKYLANAARKKMSTNVFCNGYSRALNSFLRKNDPSKYVYEWENGDEPSSSRTGTGTGDDIGDDNACTAQNDQEKKGVVRKHESLGPRTIDFSGAVRCLKPRAKSLKKQPKDKSVKTKMGSPSGSPRDKLKNLRPQSSSSFFRTRPGPPNFA